MERALYTSKLLSITGDVSADDRPVFIESFQKAEHNPAYIFGFSVFFGFLGVDRFLIGDWGRGLAKLFTLGGLGLWWFVDTALIAGRAREKNLASAQQIANSFIPSVSHDSFTDTEEVSVEPDLIDDPVQVQAASAPREKQVQFKSRPPKGFRSRPQGRVPA